MVLGKAKNGAYSELFANLSPEVTKDKNGAYIIPFGRFGQIPDHIQKSINEGNATRFYNWSVLP